MTGHEERELTPEEEARLTALLREAAEPTAVPADVAARLDQVLAGLREERSTADSGSVSGPESAPLAQPVSDADVVPLHRRRRRGALLLAAAAAVVAGGFGIPALLDNDATLTQTSDRASTRSTDQSGAESGAESLPEGGAAGSAGGASTAPEPSTGADSPPLRVAPGRELRLVPTLGPVELTQTGLEEQVLAALRAGRSLDVVPDPESSTSEAQCPEPTLAVGQSWTPATYDGQPAVLVADPERAGSVAASVLDCGGDELATLAVPVG